MRCSHAVVVMLTLGLLPGCSAPDAPAELGAAPEKPADDASPPAAVEAEADAEADAAVAESRSVLEDLRLKVYELHETFAGLQAAAQAEYAERVEGLGDMLREADEQFAQLRESGNDAVDEGRRTLQDTLDRLEAAYQEIVDALADL